MVLLQGYDFDIVHKSGKSHGNADALSRRQYEEQPLKFTEPAQVHSNTDTQCETLEYKQTDATDIDSPLLSIDNLENVTDQPINVQARQRLDDYLNQYIVY